MKAYTCCNCFDYSLSNKCSGHICRGPEEARSAFISPHSHSFHEDHANTVSSQNTSWHHHTCILNNDHRIISLLPRARCIRESFALPSTLQKQEDYSPRGQYIHQYIDQFFSELSIKTTIEIRRGKSSQPSDRHRRTTHHPINTINPSNEIHLNKGVF